MNHEIITTDDELRDFCRSIERSHRIAFDTEFVSEYSYRPELCLVQVAVDGRLILIDPTMIEDVSPFWQVVAAAGHETIVHAGREEFRFCRQATKARPAALFDIQIAAGLVGLEYPAAYGTLTYRLLNKSLSKGETRTDWRRRPLSAAQQEYALLDVIFLERMRDILWDRLERLGRVDWFYGEMELWQQRVEEYEEGERWRRLGGITGFSPRHLALVKAIWHWRDDLAANRNWPTKRILRDDLIIELARRESADLQDIRSVRGLERGDLQKHMERLSQLIKAAIELPVEECPQPLPRSTRPQLNLLGQFLHTAVSSLCREANLAPSIVGTVEDVRDLIAYQLDIANARSGSPPTLATGWRAEVIGCKIEQLLAGELSIRIKNPLSDEPLAIG